MDIAATLAFEHEAGADIWIGQWTPALRNALLDRLQVRRPLTMAEITENRLKSLKKGIMTVCRTLGEAVAMIWAKRREAIHTLHPELATPTSQRSRAATQPSNQDNSQPSITSHFRPVPSTSILRSPAPQQSPADTTTAQPSVTRTRRPEPYRRRLRQLLLHSTIPTEQVARPPRPRPWVITDTPSPLRNRIQTTLLIRTTTSPQPKIRQHHRSPRTTVCPRIRWRNRGPEQVCNHEPRMHDTDNRRPASRPDQSDRSPRTHSSPNAHLTAMYPRNCSSIVSNSIYMSSQPAVQSPSYPADTPSRSPPGRE